MGRPPRAPMLSGKELLIAAAIVIGGVTTALLGYAGLIEGKTSALVWIASSIVVIVVAVVWSN